MQFKRWNDACWGPGPPSEMLLGPFHQVLHLWTLPIIYLEDESAQYSNPPPPQTSSGTCLMFKTNCREVKPRLPWSVIEWATVLSQVANAENTWRHCCSGPSDHSCKYLFNILMLGSMCPSTKAVLVPFVKHCQSSLIRPMPPSTLTDIRSREC